MSFVLSRFETRTQGISISFVIDGTKLKHYNRLFVNSHFQSELYTRLISQHFVNAALYPFNFIVFWKKQIYSNLLARMDETLLISSVVIKQVYFVKFVQLLQKLSEVFVHLLCENCRNNQTNLLRKQCILSTSNLFRYKNVISAISFSRHES